MLYSYFNDKITYDWDKNDKEAENDCSSSGVYSDGWWLHDTLFWKWQGLYSIRTSNYNKKLKVIDTVAQKTVKSLEGRSVRLDVYAKDNKGKPYDIEIQRADKGAGAKRARYNSALMDADITVPGEDAKNYSTMKRTSSM